MEYIRKCPDCGCDLIYTDKYHFNHSNKLGRRCRSCSQMGKTIPEATRVKMRGENNHNFGKPSQTRKRPFEWILTKIRLNAKHRGIGCDLTYDEFLEFINTPFCEYCSTPVYWEKHHINSKTINFGHNLDRKDNNLGYTKSNLVCCCWRCNQTKRE